MARVLFVSGFNRSGTTLVTSAVARAAQARTLTVGDLARHMPSVERFLATAGRGADRGVDRLSVTAQTPEEYGWLLNAATGDFSFDPRAERGGVLRSLVDELAAEGHSTIVLKNPWDTGRERLLLDHFPESQILLVRRKLSAIEDSQRRAWDRMAESNRYTRALFVDTHSRAQFLASVLDPRARQRMVAEASHRMRRTAVRLARDVPKLPLDRVAFLSYDELRADPLAGAVWAAHVVEPGALAQAVAAETFPEYHRAEPRDWPSRAIDWYWARCWRRVRTRQVRNDILTAPPPRDRRPFRSRIGQ